MKVAVANFVYLENLIVASHRFQLHHIAATVVVCLLPCFSHAGVIIFNGADFSHTPGSAVTLSLDGDDADYVSLPETQASASTLNAVEVPAAMELNTPAIIATAIGLVILTTRRKKKADNGRQSLWGALGNAPPVAGM